MSDKKIRATFKDGVFVITINEKFICSCKPKELQDTLEELADALDDVNAFDNKKEGK
jgi:hypothetical protein